ncbi:Ribosomal RNA small subunit methyltransferase D [Roseovarius litorisediminis]|uniref:Ribosomal RNA small subunit methyltransferase D n=1 Tax=Roseovarius litorisediminis TaxID=1312363 RepID=A0A1Y5RZM6_9RHOB|nr:16S rRNA (guanine(966)-N(2))-methyltransferase RsmD [Roseovarius litorisediminis]SLN28981.1 Ribosomal RNA small subunit methyltransferase D [Roseovarius litorisediminis]
MRIIGGQHRGRTLASVGKGDAAAHLRPTTDRVRESLFNVLAGAYGDPVTGARVLDIFAGTGALGLEALSRGAEFVGFVEDGRKAQAILQQNINLLRAETQTKLFRKDVRRLGENPGAAYDLIFLDPPYGKGLGEAAMEAALRGGWIADDALIVWEENTALVVPEGLSLLEARKYGDTMISFLERS